MDGEKEDLYRFNPPNYHLIILDPYFGKSTRLALIILEILIDDHLNKTQIVSSICSTVCLRI